jgi:hypothetical protein
MPLPTHLLAGTRDLPSIPSLREQVVRSGQRKQMGGMGGWIRGKTKIEVYKKFRADVNRKHIENASDGDAAPSPAVCPEAFPIKASD